ncbi:hypothetical protein AB0L71_28430 [Streptomyces sp. NPDC052052]|uniref:hypothetical protein n=1 Tax=Streptomyces sp. NPDC052052 TaxID=3154756 RepID=UPI0034373BC4
MSVISHARTHPATINYGDLTADQQTRFDDLMDQADNTASATTYDALMAAAIAITGIRTPRHSEILLCACPCTCGCIFDAHDPDALPTEQPDGYNLGRLQCPDCADAHPRPIED